MIAAGLQALAQAAEGWPALLLLALSAAGCFCLLLSALLVLRFGTGRPPPRAATGGEGVTVLVPLCGDEPGLEGRLQALLAQEHAGPLQLVCGVQDAGDPAAAAVRRLAARRLQDGPAPVVAELVVDGRSHGRNRKVSNLANMAAQARHDILVLVDSDIEVPPGWLAAVLDCLRQPGTGAVTCLYHGRARGGFWARLAATATDLHFLPNVCLGLSLGLAHPCFGATIALRRDILERIGGLPAFADRLVDDHAIGAAVRSLGLRLARPAFTVGHVFLDRTAGEFLARQLRQARTIRTVDPAGHAGAVLTHPLPLALLAALAGAPAALAGGLALLALAARLALGLAVRRRFRLPPQPYWAIPLLDLVLFALHLASLSGRSVLWRGRRYRVAGDGRLGAGS